ncbi:MAG: FAD-dependent oxidoreductase [Acidobacteria bacterium]|nr:MAG: FAD-dependent oxidoreductase [Acidobacteriota bacterium]REK04050.1 MAG: FAD-dependent oxidoreductase [Acidobacteriota bacterium]REK15212.1 MAG: FAD-dependent oxidoreductase [Acidobacteriota bacterium]REK46302.1 MAG: FAD-dependent oxidoreductase [Acidobacteriota bacterium]
MTASAGKSDCLIAGGGPAGMMLGVLLARQGVKVTVLEKHADFLRDFRGDTVHPSTLEILDQIGILPEFKKLPQNKVQQLGVHIGDRVQQVVDFRGLSPFDYLSFVPQWDFLDLLADHGRQFGNFDLRMRHKATGLIIENGECAGVRVESPEGRAELRARVTVACDGRHSILREQAGLKVMEFGAPMDVLWFRVPRTVEHPNETFGILGAGKMMVLLNRGDYWQVAYLVPKGKDSDLRETPIEEFRRTIEETTYFLEDETGIPASWDDVKTLEVKVDRLEKWFSPGLLVIGDAAHAMSPVGGVGINLAIQDAVAASNALGPKLLSRGRVPTAVFQSIQDRRLFPTKLVQLFQIQAQKRVITAALASKDRPPDLPAILRFLLKFRFFRNIPARFIGYGIGRERVRGVSG